MNDFEEIVHRPDYMHRVSRCLCSRSESLLFGGQPANCGFAFYEEGDAISGENNKIRFPGGAPGSVCH